MPALRKAKYKPFTKEIITKGYGFNTPQDGSVCKIKIILDEKNVITELNDSNEKEIVVGDVDEPVDRILEDCIRTMKEEEVCSLLFLHPCLNDDSSIPEDSVVEATAVENDENKSEDVKDPTSSDQNSTEAIDENVETQDDCKKDDQSLEVTKAPESVSSPEETLQEKLKNIKNLSNAVEIHFQLLSYTREPEIWEMSITEKWRRASYHKQRGLELYSRGAYQYAFRRFGLTLKYVISLEHDVPSMQEEGMDIKGLKLSCYLNVAACQMRHHNYDSVVINSSKALKLQPNNAKALYRRGSAYVQLQEYEKAKDDLDIAQQLEPKNQAIAKQQQLLKSQVQKLNQYYASAMKKYFS
ncbi:uncharacterized protein [Parasteatoda tepidariorum]|uniref:uncharacterized protein n=1 Tax=Parasteatoda tepidariorum TaxID=114398 RepID=UPI00077FCAEB|nr:peptidyl-prolyl cis-trans isomerase FKBP62 [Parasteatoda tepidariorum]XP_015929702.1 peptidyl-prolyl cis-trans isomerase FKBP62 [Parasteatoda tepidariorum]XP_042895410.1 peptidyl-prolyl cis-trans isomerase FKBP62 [Parasteatoda tepidariorum]XP_042895411.1 peptidyl-prolyl cis-trans isomerase FKBP62 [Parasteatoda tepidariorum]